MGAWGTGILQNDTTADIWSEFKEHYNNGLSGKEIRIKLEEEYKPDSEDEYYGEIWTGIAHGQWMYGELENYTLKKVRVSTNKKWLILWAENEKLLQQRTEVLKEFMEKIKTPRPKPLKRKRILERPPYFKRGDVIGIKINEDNYLVALVIDQNDFPEYGENTIVITDMLFNNQPTINDVLKAEVLYLDIGGPTSYHRSYYWAIFGARNMSRKIKDTVKIGEVGGAGYLSLGNGIRIGDWNKIPELYNEQVEFMKSNKSEKPFVVTINNILHPIQDLQDKLIEWDNKRWMEVIERAKHKAGLNK